jgi:hypothetical protein
MKPARTGILVSLRAAQRWPKAWAWVVALLVAAQFGLLLHQSQHHLNPKVRTSDDCTLCQFAQNMTTGPAAPILVLPVFILLGAAVLAVYTAPRVVPIALPFRSRAPPLSIRR